MYPLAVISAAYLDGGSNILKENGFSRKFVGLSAQWNRYGFLIVTSPFPSLSQEGLDTAHSGQRSRPFSPWAMGQLCHSSLSGDMQLSTGNKESSLSCHTSASYST